FFTVYTDALDDNGKVHDFSHVMKLFYDPIGTGVNGRRALLNESYKRLDGVLDGHYESLAEHENNVLGIKNWQFNPAFTVGGGLQFHLAKFMTLGIEERVIITGSDLLDGYR